MVDEARCSWCGEGVPGDDGYRLAEEPGARHAVFCRLEHVIPWALKGAHWEAGEGFAAAVDGCAWCEKQLSEVKLVLIRHRGEHRIPDGFCSVDHLRAWAAAGGRWR
jgi:hypothetical protein